MQPNLAVVKPDKKEAMKNAADFENVFSNERRTIQASAEKNFPTNIDTASDGVFVIDNVLTDEECAILCSRVDGCEALAFWNANGRENEAARMFRDADTIEVHSTNIATEIWCRVAELLTNRLTVDINDDADDPNWEREMVGRWVPSKINHDLLFAKYPSFGSFAPHTDGRAIHDFNTRSMYSVIIFLNTIPTPNGGGTKFYRDIAVRSLVKKARCAQSGEDSYWTADPEHVTAEVDPVAGRMLIFHQSLVHEGVPPTKPYSKYILRTDVMFARQPPICDGEQDREAYRIFRVAEDLAEAGDNEAATPLFRKAFKLSPEMARIMGQG